MTDVFTKKQRSVIMSRIRSRGNAATELKLIYLFKQYKITGWRRNSKLFGKPDFIFPKKRLAVFVDGEFWHGHPTRSKIPHTNKKFWIKKIQANKKRDILVNKTLKKRGWGVIRVWQKDISKPQTIRRFLAILGR